MGVATDGCPAVAYDSGGSGHGCSRSRSEEPAADASRRECGARGRGGICQERVWRLHRDRCCRPDLQGGSDLSDLRQKMVELLDVWRVVELIELSAGTVHVPQA